MGYLLLWPQARISVLALPVPIVFSMPGFVVVGVWAAMQFHKIQDFLGFSAAAPLGYSGALAGALIGGFVLVPLLVGWTRRGEKKRKSGAKRSA
jgi:membrane associated rhomboid family serine protease